VEYFFYYAANRDANRFQCFQKVGSTSLLWQFTTRFVDCPVNSNRIQELGNISLNPSIATASLQENVQAITTFLMGRFQMILLILL
jgi:hypothetical protein